MQHTPGPWVFIESNDARIPDRITSATGSPVASGSIGINRHDARLIAAAPDLLAALQDLASFDDWSCHENQIGFVMRDIARCAIAEMMDEDTQPGATK